MITDTQDLKKILINKGIKPSYIRLKILEYLITKENHPTVDEIYQELKQIFPTLSKTTIYLNLNLFVKYNIVRSFNMDNNEQRFDFIKQEHINFFCEKCKKVYDIPVNEIKIEYQNNEHKIKETVLYLKGICKECFQFP
jgi:Fur family peroxide stress response transcriptional regulator